MAAAGARTSCRATTSGARSRSHFSNPRRCAARIPLMLKVAIRTTVQSRFSGTPACGARLCGTGSANEAGNSWSSRPHSPVCAKGDLNPHVLSDTGSGSQRVCHSAPRRGGSKTVTRRLPHYEISRSEAVLQRCERDGYRPGNPVELPRVTDVANRPGRFADIMQWTWPFDDTPGACVVVIELGMSEGRRSPKGGRDGHRLAI